MLQKVEHFIEGIERLSSTIHMDFLMATANCDNKMRFTFTERLIAPCSQALPPPISNFGLRHNLDLLVNQHMADVMDNKEEHWLDLVFYLMLSHWSAVADSPALPWGVVHYVNNRASHIAHHGQRWFHHRAWQSVPATIRDPPSSPWALKYASSAEALSGSLEMLWRLLYCRSSTDLDISTLEPTLEAVLCICLGPSRMAG
ncbi:hypothetical protein C8R47DRAFT_1090948 [Mycena vitilis]|nr:hypothetical protein C8R47DRAFT_1090948 [Mycena vitilis]